MYLKIKHTSELQKFCFQRTSQVHNALHVALIPTASTCATRQSETTHEATWSFTFWSVHFFSIGGFGLLAEVAGLPWTLVAVLLRCSPGGFYWSTHRILSMASNDCMSMIRTHNVGFSNNTRRPAWPLASWENPTVPKQTNDLWKQSPPASYVGMSMEVSTKSP